MNAVCGGWKNTISVWKVRASRSLRKRLSPNQEDNVQSRALKTSTHCPRCSGKFEIFSPTRPGLLCLFGQRHLLHYTLLRWPRRRFPWHPRLIIAFSHRLECSPSSRLRCSGHPFAYHLIIPSNARLMRVGCRLRLSQAIKVRRSEVKCSSTIRWEFSSRFFACGGYERWRPRQ